MSSNSMVCMSNRNKCSRNTSAVFNPPRHWGFLPLQGCRYRYRDRHEPYRGKCEMDRMNRKFFSRTYGTRYLTTKSGTRYELHDEYTYNKFWQDGKEES
jgi:hypothetical protein